MIKIEEELKENGKLSDFERAVVLNDLQSIYSIVEGIIDNHEPVKSVFSDIVIKRLGTLKSYDVNSHFNNRVEVTENDYNAGDYILKSDVDSLVEHLKDSSL